MAPERLQNHLRRTRPVDAVALRLHQQFDGVQNMGLVVGDQQARHLPGSRANGFGDFDLFTSRHDVP